MSTLVRELDLMLDRFLVICNTEAELRQLFEAWGDDLVGDFGHGQKLDLQSVRIGEGPIRMWMSLNLGKRAHLNMRLSLVGLSIEGGLLQPQSVMVPDALVFWTPHDNRSSTQLWANPMPPQWAEVPCIALGMAPQSPTTATFEEKAQRIWLQRHFSKLLYLENPKNFLREGLDWVLSF